MGHDVFISYSSRDKTTADGMCALLEANGIRCWVAPRDILPGADWGESIIDAINGAKVFVLVFSANANSSVQIKREVERAVHKGLPIIPFRIEDVVPAKSLEYFLSTPHWLDAFTPPIEQHIGYLADTIKKLIDAPAHAGPVPIPGARKEMPLQPQKWQLGAGAAVMAVLAAWYFLAPPSGTRPVPASAPAAPVNEQQSFVGKWQAAKMTPTEGAMAPLLDNMTMGVLMHAAYTGPDVTGEFDVSKLGQYHYMFSAEDHGTVSGTRTRLTFTSALSGKPSVVQPQFVTPDFALNMANIGAEPGETGMVLNMKGRGQMPWFGKPAPDSGRNLPVGVVGHWHNKAIVAPGLVGSWTGALDIAADGTYRLKITEVESGLFQAENGQWTRTPDAGIPTKGNYAFEDKDTFTAASNTGSATWKRVN
jgi:hypothetical protein